MWALAVIAGLIASGAVTLRLIGRDKVPPMERRDRALAALRDLAGQPRPEIPDFLAHNEPPTDHVRILEGEPADAIPERRAATRRTARPTRAPRERGRLAEPEATDARPPIERRTIEIRRLSTRPTESDPVAAEPVAEGARFTRARRARRARPALVPSRVVVGVAAVAAAAVAIGIIVAGGLNDRGPARAAATSVPQNVGTRRLTASTTTTSATAPARLAPVVVRSTGGATVSAHAPFRLTLHATGTCWVEITDATAHTLFTTTLQSGQEQQIPVAGPVVVRLGYTPAMIVSVDGVALDLSGLSQTTNLNFQTG